MKIPRLGRWRPSSLVGSLALAAVRLDNDTGSRPERFRLELLGRRPDCGTGTLKG